MTQPDYDLLVVGAGIHGTGVAQGAAAAGYRVLVVEKSEIAAGTSRASSKLIHGGLRYLETMQFGLVRESLRERQILLRNAPHLVRLVPFFIPVYRQTRRRPWQIRAGLSLYSALLGFQKDSRFEQWPRRRWDELEGLRQDDLQAVFRYHDGQTDDAALCRAVMQSAMSLGAYLRVGTTLEHATVDGDGVRAHLAGPGGFTEKVRARALVNAAGPWVNLIADRIQPAPPRFEVDLVAGSHIELDGPTRPGIYYTEAPEDRRAVFVIPWRGHTLVGTTERVHHDSPDQLQPTAGEMEYLERVFRHHFPEREVRHRGAFAGLRVLPRGEGGLFGRRRDVTLVADHDRRPRVVSLYGGKLTGYRSTALEVLHCLRRTLPAARPLADTRTLRLPEVRETGQDTRNGSPSSRPATSSPQPPGA